jgi:hypothetical protein
MCGPGQQPGSPSGAATPGTAGEALSMVMTGLGWLAAADMACMPSAVQADCLRELERAVSVHTAARARVLAAFDAGTGIDQDGCQSARSWLAWQTRTTYAAAAGTVGWMRRLRAHPAVAGALRGAAISVSWARQICDWTDRLPGHARRDADLILLAAAAGGADLAGLASLADQLRRALAEPDRDGAGDGGFEDRYLRLATTFDGAGRLDGDLTPQCAAAVQVVLDALGKKAGPEDCRTQRQRHHDALEEACGAVAAVTGGTGTAHLSRWPVSISPTQRDEFGGNSDQYGCLGESSQSHSNDDSRFSSTAPVPAERDPRPSLDGLLHGGTRLAGRDHRAPEDAK